MTTPVDLVWLGPSESVPTWPHGSASAAEPSPAGVAEALDRLLERGDSAPFVLFWASSAGGVPNAEVIGRLLRQPGDVFHAGLALGTGGLPRLMDFVAPTWMLNRDPDATIEATSWRLSLAACLVRTDALRQLGGVKAEFLTVAGSGLELGHRLVSRGAFVRHVPSLLTSKALSPSRPVNLPLEDELRFAVLRFGRRWARWALARAVLSGAVGATETLQAARRLAHLRTPPPLPAYQRPVSDGANPPRAGRVTILIPTVDRYPYLLTLLEQLREQTIPPHEILVVDQTARDRRTTDMESRFPDLPLRVITMDRAGQCSSRNAGLRAATGDYILFLDDDDEVQSDLIERHLGSLDRFRSDVSSGVAMEVGAGPLPESFTFVRTSDVFPTNNTLVGRDVLARSGLFDLAFDRGARADHDLGTRIYLSGALMVLNPDISVLHHHAPQGGLRTHGARVVTYASSRSRLAHRNLPSVTQLYLGRRYFSERQVREALWIAVLGTFSVRGSRARRLLKAVLSALLLPDTLRTLRARMRASSRMLLEYPKIPAFPQTTPERNGA
jgi:glycosyltransferase involved in cell wall biosynthesis